MSTISFQAAACSKTIKASVAPSWPPFSYVEDGVYKGLDIEILKLILSKADLCADFVSYPSSSRALKELEHSRVDLIFAASFSEERAKYAIFSTPYRYESMQLFANTENSVVWGQSKHSVVAINRGSYYGALFQKQLAECEKCIVETNHVKERINLLKKKRVDFAVEEYLSGSYLILKEGISDIVEATNIVVNSNPVHYMLAPQNFNEDEVDRLNQAIKASDEEIGTLVEKYQQLQF